MIKDVIIISIIVIIFLLRFFYKTGVKAEKMKKLEQEQINKTSDVNNENKPDAYRLYCLWAKKRNITPIIREEFDNLADENGSISLSDLMSLHKDEETKIKPYDSKAVINDTSEDNKDDNSFVNSAIIGGVTKSTTTGFLLGGDLFGAMFGEFLGGDD